jgi:hypothetical protein
MANMQIVNSGIMFLTVSFGTQGGIMGDPNEWARALGEELESKQRVERDIAKTVAMNRDIEA